MSSYILDMWDSVDGWVVTNGPGFMPDEYTTLLIPDGPVAENPAPLVSDLVDPYLFARGPVHPTNLVA